MSSARSKLKEKDRERSFAEHAEKLLIDLSDADTMGAALREWRCQGVVQDMGEARYRCQLRNTGPSQHLLTIEHRDDTTKTLLVNVTTILRYSIPVKDADGHYILEPRKVRDLLRSRLRECKAKASLMAFREEVLKQGNPAAMTSMMLLDVTSPISPKTLRALFQKLEAYDVKFDPKCFQVELESMANWKSFLAMYPWERWEIYGALSPKQQHYCEQYRLEKPDALAKQRYAIGW